MATAIAGMSTYRILLRRTNVWSAGRSRHKTQRANLLVETADGVRITYWTAVTESS